MAVTDPLDGYHALLKRNAKLNAYCTAVITIHLASISPGISGFLDGLLPPIATKFLEEPIPLGRALPALVIPWFFFVFNFHEMISRRFGIREKYDIRYILTPMAVSLGFLVGITMLKSFKENRRELMKTCFYPFVNEGNENAIDMHFIRGAFHNLSTLWFFLEFSAICLFASVIALFIAWKTAAVYLSISVLFYVLYKFQMSINCARASGDEVKEIVRDEGRASLIRGVFGALQR